MKRRFGVLELATGFITATPDLPACTCSERSNTAVLG
jgi:hypothetical protein